jgi:hypothetical protein
MRVSVRQDSPLEGCIPDLASKLARTPLCPDRQPEVKLTLFGALALPKNHEVVCPGQNSQQCCEFWGVGVSLVELLHPPQVRGREPLQVWSPSQQPVGQLFHDPFAPACLGHLPGQMCSNRPVGLNKRDIDGLIRLGPACPDDAENLGEFGILLRQFRAHSVNTSNRVIMRLVTPFSSSSISCTELRGLNKYVLFLSFGGVNPLQRSLAR